jgi:Mn2+/Fe2+ NRAMP family transporter
MGITFLATALYALGQTAPVSVGSLRPALPEGALLITIALIGTTVVPYNLFLHASAVAQKWPRGGGTSLRRVRIDSAASIGVGGVITMSIVITAALFHRDGGEIEGAMQIAALLEPVLGSAARGLFLVGLFAAGITSAVTAPLAAGYACAGCLGWQGERRQNGMRLVSGAVLGVGTLFAILGRRPLTAIVVAQAVNGVLLPFLASFLLLAVNRSELLGRHRNGWIANALGFAVVAVALGLGGAQVYSVLSRGV